jgi:hypothetical protein
VTTDAVNDTTPQTPQATDLRERMKRAIKLLRAGFPSLTPTKRRWLLQEVTPGESDPATSAPTAIQASVTIWFGKEVRKIEMYGATEEEAVEKIEQWFRDNPPRMLDDEDAETYRNCKPPWRVP